MSRNGEIRANGREWVWVRAWVRLVDGRLVLTWQAIGAGWRRGGSRELRPLERLAWRLVRKVPKP